MDLDYDTIYYGTRHLLSSFLALDCEHHMFNYVYNYCSMIASLSNTIMDVNVWHAKLDHIG